MAEKVERTPSQNVRPEVQVTQQTNTRLQEVNASVAALRTETDRARGLFGFGRRILVPPDEIHVVVGDGRHVMALSNERKVFGQSADRSSRYWLNAFTQVIKLKTISFTVPLRGHNGGGIPALDSSKVSFRLWAHAVAKLNPDKAEVAAQRVGLDTTGLVNTIAEVGTAELVAAAATMGLEEIIANRQRLAEIAFPKVNQILSELGYDLALLTITQLDGEAYSKLVQQAEARISKETGVATNREQLAELQDVQTRQRSEAEIRAETEKKLASERLEAEREVETATIAQQDALEARRHEMQIMQIGRTKSAAEKQHETELAKVELNQQLGEAEAERQARLARLQAEKEAELKALQQQRLATINLAETEAEARRLAMQQVREIERAAELTEAEAQRLRQEELAQAERAKEVAIIEALQVSEALRIEAERAKEVTIIEATQESQSLKIKAQAETETELIRAEAEATAVEKRAQATKIRAEATRAEAAAAGLAEAEVEEARIHVAEKQVAVTRAQALAEVEKVQKLKEVEIHAETALTEVAEKRVGVTRAEALVEVEKVQKLKEVELTAQEAMAKLFDVAPVLVDLERMKLQMSHEQALARIQAEASLKAFEAIAPGIKVNIFGNGGQTGQLLANLMSLSHGLTNISEEIPVVQRLLNGEHSNGHSNGQVGIGALLPRLTAFAPYLKQAVADINPRMLTSLKVADLVDRLGAVIAGQDDLVTALQNIREDASFRVIGDMPVGPILNVLGLTPNEADEIEVTEIAIQNEPAEADLAA